jgi:hypothetical protein
MGVGAMFKFSNKETNSEGETYPNFIQGIEENYIVYDDPELLKAFNYLTGTYTKEVEMALRVINTIASLLQPTKQSMPSIGHITVPPKVLPRGVCVNAEKAMEEAEPKASSRNNTKDSKTTITLASDISVWGHEQFWSFFRQKAGQYKRAYSIMYKAQQDKFKEIVDITDNTILQQIIEEFMKEDVFNPHSASYFIHTGYSATHTKILTGKYPPAIQQLKGDDFINKNETLKLNVAVIDKDGFIF